MTDGPTRNDDARGVRGKRRSRRVRPPTAREQLEALLGYPVVMGRPPKYDLSTWTVTDDWPDPVPVTEAEVAVFEQWFGDLFDELFGPQD